MYLAKYNSMSEIITACDKAYKRGSIFHSLTNSYELQSYSWTGYTGGTLNNWNDVKVACAQPWKDGLDKIQVMLYELDRYIHTLPRPMDRRRRRVYSDNDGDTVDTDRLRSGQPYWMSVVRQHVPGPQYISIIANVSSVGARSADSIMWRGACACVLTDMLEKVGYRCEVWAVDRCINAFLRPIEGDYETVVAVSLKNAQDPLDTAILVNGVSGWFYRTILGFQSLHVPEHTPRRSYGAPQAINDDTPCVSLLAGVGSKAIVIDDVWNIHAAVAKVKDIIEKLNDGRLIQLN